MTNDVATGTQIAGYRVEGVLGRGGMSVVYLAEQVRLGRKVALKLLAPALAEDTAFRARFERECRLAASIVHPNVIPIYDAGEVDGHLYLAMRYVEGLDLRALLARAGPLDASDALAILRQVAGALDAAHERGLVHRDVKPGNILCMFGPRPTEIGHVYLADFGLTKRSASQSGLTRMGQFVGTLDYVAPEQIEGRALDGRTDMYALGCVLYECLTGEVPFPRDSDPAVLYAHLREPVPTIEARRPDIPHGIDDIIARATAKAASQRYDSGASFIAALQHLLGVPVVVMPAIEPRQPETTIATRLDVSSAVDSAGQAVATGLARVRAFVSLALERLKPSPLHEALESIAADLDQPLRVAVVGFDAPITADLASALRTAVPPLEFLPGTVDAAATPAADLMARCPAHVVVFPVDATGTRRLQGFLQRLKTGGASPVRTHAVVTAMRGAETPAKVRSVADSLNREPAVRALCGEVIPLVSDGRTRRREASIEPLIRKVRTTLRERADRLRMDWALTRVELALREFGTGLGDDVLANLRDDLEELRLGLFDLDELHSLDDLLAGRLVVSDAQGVELERLLDQGDVSARLGFGGPASVTELRTAAQAGAERWRSFLDASRPTGRLRRAAEVAAGSYDRLWAGVEGASHQV